LTNLQITNNATIEGSIEQIEFNMTFTRSTPFAQTVTKTFTLTVALNSLGCGQASRGGSSLAASSRGIWRRGTALSGGSSSASRVAAKAGAMPDLQIKPSDVSFSPSVPSRGDTVNVQFRMSNSGDAAASKVPVVLIANGQQVASDTFDVAAGSSTLGGLNWNTTNLQTAPARPVAGNAKLRVRDVSGANRGGRVVREELDRSDGVATPQAQVLSADVKLVIDPAGTIKQKSAANKVVALTQLQVRPGAQTELARSGITPAGGGGEQVWVEVREMCIGLRMPSAAATNCEGTDLDLYVEDVGMGKYALSSMFGIADLGSAFAGDISAAAKTASYTTRVNLVSGHAYAIQGASGKTSIFTLSQVLSPSQFAELMKAKLGRTGRRITRNLGGETGTTEAGDVSGFDPSKAIVYFDLLMRPAAE
jgi:hypothetical protein